MIARRLVVLALAALVGTGCGATGVDRALRVERGPIAVDRVESDYTRLVLALRSAETARDRTARQSAPEPGIRLQLADVAADAREAAAQTADDRTAIHLYLIAALAAWQAGSDAEELLAQVAREGVAKCDAMQGQATRPPRDCTQLSVVPALAINDVLVARLAALRGLPAGDEARRATEAAALTDKTRQNFDRLAVRRDALAADRTVSPSYREYLDRQLYVLYCNHAEAATQLSLTERGRDDGRRAVETAIGTLKPRLAPAYRGLNCTEFRD